jgi:hypothetical protein
MKRARKSRSGGRPRDKQKTDYAGMYWPVKVLASSDGLRCSMTTAKWRLSARQRAPFCRPVRRGAYSAVEARTVFSIRQSRCSPGRFWCASFEWLGNPSVCRRGRLQRPYPSSTAGARWTGLRFLFHSDDLVVTYARVFISGSFSRATAASHQVGEFVEVSNASETGPITWLARIGSD